MLSLIGLLLAVAGAASMLLPMLGMQHPLFDFIQPWQPFLGVGLVVVGAVLVKGLDGDGEFFGGDTGFDMGDFGGD